jgi:hypothetical protein
MKKSLNSSACSLQTRAKSRPTTTSPSSRSKLGGEGHAGCEVVGTQSHPGLFPKSAPRPGSAPRYYLGNTPGEGPALSASTGKPTAPPRLPIPPWLGAASCSPYFRSGRFWCPAAGVLAFAFRYPQVRAREFRGCCVPGAEAGAGSSSWDLQGYHLLIPRLAILGDPKTSP